MEGRRLEEWGLEEEVVLTRRWTGSACAILFRMPQRDCAFYLQADASYIPTRSAMGGIVLAVGAGQFVELPIMTGL